MDTMDDMLTVCLIEDEAGIVTEIFDSLEEATRAGFPHALARQVTEREANKLKRLTAKRHQNDEEVEGWESLTLDELESEDLTGGPTNSL